MSDGIIVGSDDTQEWLLPWWWKHYSKTNDHPVTFVDYGMTDEAKEWCRKRGKLVRLEVADIFVVDKRDIDLSRAKIWESTYGREFWTQRSSWFKKPLACLLSPYDRSIWIDLDCEIRGSIEKLFIHADHPSGIAMAQDIQEGYNSGVIVFKKGLPLLKKWADEAFHTNHLYAGDQDILTKIITADQVKIMELAPIYNWSRIKGKSADAVIYHWHGRHGKTVIAHSLSQK